MIYIYVDIIIVVCKCIKYIFCQYSQSI